MKNQLFQFLVTMYRLQRRITKTRAWVALESLARRAYWKSRLAHFGNQTGIFRDVVIHHPQSVSIGDGCSIAEFVHIWGGGGVEIGNNVLVASHVAITSMTHDVEAVIFGETSVKKAVMIEDNVWIGAGAVILPGVRLGTGCVVGAGAVVTKDVAANSIVVGIPAQKIRQLVPSSEQN